MCPAFHSFLLQEQGPHQQESSVGKGPCQHWDLSLALAGGMPTETGLCHLSRADY